MGRKPSPHMPTHSYACWTPPNCHRLLPTRLCRAAALLPAASKDVGRVFPIGSSHGAAQAEDPAASLQLHRFPQQMPWPPVSRQHRCKNTASSTHWHLSSLPPEIMIQQRHTGFSTRVPLHDSVNISVSSYNRKRQCVQSLTYPSPRAILTGGSEVMMCQESCPALLLCKTLAFHCRSRRMRSADAIPEGWHRRCCHA